MVDAGEQVWGRAWPRMFDSLNGNPWAAMPSLHFGWALMVAVGFVAIKRSRRSLVAFAHPQHHQRNMQSGRTGADRHRVVHGVVSLQRALKSFKFRAEAEARRAQNSRNSFNLCLGNVGGGKGNRHSH